MKPPYAIGSVPSLSGHAIAYRWRSLPRVCRHRASKPQGSSERVLPWQITMDQLIFASRRTVRSETTLFLRQDPHALAVLAEAAIDDLQQYLAGVRYQRDAPVVAALCPVFLFVEYHDDGIFPRLRYLAFLPNTNDDIEQSPAQGGIAVEGDLEQLNGDSVRSDSLSVRQRADGICQLLHRGLNS